MYHNPLIITREAEGIEEINTKYTYKWDLERNGCAELRKTVEAWHPEKYKRKKTEI